MLKNVSRTYAIAIWFGLLAILAAASVVAGAAATLSTWTLLLLMALAPPTIALIVWRGAPQPTVAELLYAVNQDRK